MKTLSNIGLVFLSAVALIGCALFEKPAKSGGSNADQGICEDYCKTFVSAYDDCLQTTASCEIMDTGEAENDCTDECLDLAAGLTEEDHNSSVECMECIIDEIGTSADCWEWEATHYDFCYEECAPVEDIGWEFEWFNYVDVDCW